MILTNPFDSPESVRARETQTDPLVMYLVVRRKRVPSLDALLAAAATATVKVERKYAKDPRFAADFARWHAGSFRKVTLRANERDWPKVLAQYPEHVLGVTEGVPIAAALPPRARSAADKVIAGLQAYVAAPDELGRAPIKLDPIHSTMLLVPNPGLAMSAGKLIAQVAHGALMCATAPAWTKAPVGWAADVAAWEQTGYLVAPRFPTAAGWVAAQAELDGCAVTDSGLTEVLPGSRTVLALRPRSGPALRAAAAILAK